MSFIMKGFRTIVFIFIVISTTFRPICPPILSQILAKNKDLIPQTKYRQLFQHYSKLPHIYGLSKIHKNGIPLRPIVSNLGSACHPLGRFLVEIINPLTGKSSSYVKNSAHFVERISDAPIHSNQMVSLDVDNLMEMLTFCVETTYFGMGSDIYRQEGLAMGHCHQCWLIYTWNTSKKWD